jgi:hypothetical protein
MNVKITTIASALALGAGLLSGADAGAVNLNTSGTLCNPYNAREATDIDYFASGVRTIASSARSVICAVPRSPVSTAYQSFYLDGSNSSGQTTLLTLYAFNYNGQFQASQSDSPSAATYSILKTLNGISTFSYVSVLATLPASGGGVYFGTTALQ